MLVREIVGIAAKELSYYELSAIAGAFSEAVRAKIEGYPVPANADGYDSGVAIDEKTLSNFCDRIFSEICKTRSIT